MSIFGLRLTHRTRFVLRIGARTAPGGTDINLETDGNEGIPRTLEHCLFQVSEIPGLENLKHSMFQLFGPPGSEFNGQNILFCSVKLLAKIPTFTQVGIFSFSHGFTFESREGRNLKHCMFQVSEFPGLENLKH